MKSLQRAGPAAVANGENGLEGERPIRIGVVIYQYKTREYSLIKRHLCRASTTSLVTGDVDRPSGVPDVVNRHRGVAWRRGSAARLIGNYDRLFDWAQNDNSLSMA